MLDHSNMTSPPAIKAFNTTDFGRLFRRERRALGKTQADVATIAGVRRQTIADMERGLSVSTLTALAALSALGKAIEIVDARYEMDRMPNFMNDEE
ncbi:MAG: helix-turn-helix protein [Rhodoferax sp.]|nr:helix-turn-helix protein [Rhodoferax sp.]